jgi:hypothetical protein
MRTHILLFGALSLWPAVSQAGDKIRPFDIRLGAWESTTIGHVTGAEIPPKQLAQMPPEMRARAEAAFKAHASQGPSKRIQKSCVTKESLDKFLKWDDTSKSNCKRTVVTSTGRKQVFHEECADASSKSSADVHFEATDSTHVKGLVHGVVTPEGGHPMHMDYTFDARWLGPSCSGIKNGH